MANRKRCSKRCGHSEGFYRDLNELSTGDFGLRKKKKKTLPGFYTVERIISSRKQEGDVSLITYSLAE